MLDRSDTSKCKWLERQALPSQLAAPVVRSRILRPVFGGGLISLLTRVAAVQFSGPSQALELPGWLAPLLFCARESVGAWSLKTA
jgi:hypothetical protein